MKSKLLSLLLILSLLLPAAWAEPLEIEPAPAEAAVPEIAEPLAPDVLPNDAAVPLKVTYTGPALSKPYDKTTDVTNALGAWLLDKQPLRSDFTLSGVEAGYESVRVTQYSVGKFAKPDVGSYSLTVTVTLAGDDAAHYTAGTAAIPAAITKRPVTVTPIPGLSKLYDADDPATLGISGVPSGLLPLTVQEIAAGAQLFTGAMSREPGEDVGRYRYRLGTLDFGNPNYDVTIAEEYFTIRPKPIGDDDVALAPIEPQAHSGKPVTPALTLTYGDRTLTQGVDFKAEFADNVNPGTAEVTLTGIGNYTGTRQAAFEIQLFSILDTGVEISKIANQTYTGKALKPALAITHNGQPLAQGKDYRLSYRNNRDVGNATVTVTGKGRYTGTRTVRFTILPAPAALSKVSAGRKRFTAQWKKSRSATGYQVAYSLTKDFANWGDKLVKGKTRLTVKGLKSKKTYYVRVRAYKRVNGKNYYSAWSAVKKVKTK